MLPNMEKLLQSVPVEEKQPLTFVNASRRTFLQVGAAGFAVAAFSKPADAFIKYPVGGTTMPHGLRYDPRIFVAIDLDGTVTITAHRSEMGTGVRTSLPMVLADEMGADWSKVKLIQAPGDEPKYGNQDTDGSRSMRHHIQSMRQMGASVRHMLARAAARKWGVSIDDVEVGVHVVTSGSKKIGFGELSFDAMNEVVPGFDALIFKTEDEFRYIGKGNIPMVDITDITTGKAIYGADVMIDGMKVAVIARPPAVGEKMAKINDKKARAVAGVEDIVELPVTVMPAKFAPLGGVAVIAAHTAAAIKGRDALEIEWSKGPHSGYNSEAFMKEMRKTASQKGKVLRAEGDLEAAKKSQSKSFAAEYTQKHMAHAPMEPPVAVANVTADFAEIWAPVQSPYGTRQDIAAALKMPIDKVKVNVTLLGGGFGRKSKCDFAIEAALLSQKAGVPIKVQWTRDDDIMHSFYHTTSVERLEASIDKNNKVTGLRFNSVSPSILSTFAADSGHHFFIEDGMGHLDIPFEIPNISIENGKAMAHTRIGWFRSVSNVPRAFAVQSFASELAHELKRDEKEVLLELIGSDRKLDPIKQGFPENFWDYGEVYEEYPIDTMRLKNVLNLAADKAKWGQSTPAGEGWGLAVHRSFVTYAAAAVRVKIVKGQIRVPEVHLAIDCGFVANPERIRSQLEGAAVMGMTLALYSGIDYENGVSQNRNFDTYQMVRSTNHPENVHVHIVEHPFSVHAAGVGEPGLPPIAPAIANAIFKATGKRLRDMPFGDTIEA